MQPVVGGEGPQRGERQFRGVGRLIVPLRVIESMAAAAIENNVLVDAADWVAPAAEESRPAQVDGVRELSAGGTQQRRGVLVAPPTNGQSTGNRSASRDEAMRGPSSGGTGR